MKIKLKKMVDNSLIPVNEIDLKRVKKLQVGKVVELDITNHRSNPQLRKYWSIAQVVIDNCHVFGEGMTSENLVDITKLEYGLCRTYKLNGVLKQVPKSISLSKMKSEQFNKFFEFSINLWSRFLQITPGELVENYEGSI